MSLIVSSTTDSQEAVNAAAGVTDAAPTPPATEETTPSEEPEVEVEEEAEPGEGGVEPEEPLAAAPQEPRKKGGFQRKIERLTQENEYRARRIEDLEAALAGRNNGHAGQQQEQPSWPRPKPTQAQFASYEEYDDAKDEWRDAKKEHEREQREREHAVARLEQERETRWQQSVGEFSTATADFEDVLSGVRHIHFGEALQKAIKDSPMGARLAYELARAPKELERIAKLPPLAAVRELGKFEAKFDSAPPTKKIEVSKAPEPITPVGRGATTSTVPLDQMDYQDFKRARQRQIAARRRQH